MQTDHYRNFDAPKRPQKVHIAWRLEMPDDDSPDAPDERDNGFWPSHNEDAAGYVDPENYDEAQRIASERMLAWRRGEWGYIGVVAVAEIAIPIGQGAFVTHTLRSAGLWGIESDVGEYLSEVFEEEKAELLSQIETLCAAITTD